jgi:pre-mRNA-processing factor 40
LERQQRRALDDLRSYMKRLEPPISPNDTYEQVKPRIAQSEEFQAVASEEARRSAFDKHIRRLKDKEEDAERDRTRRKERGDDGHRERSDRGERSHRTSGRRSRSPERDVFEADRRKHIAERERNYRKSSMVESLLSDRRSVGSPHDSRDRDRDRRDHRDRDRERDRERDRDRARSRDRDRDRDHGRDRDYDRRSRDELNHYDRERRSREEDRERVYRRRVMDRDVEELPYGDERPSSSRRPRADEDDYDRKDGRNSKRVKVENTREHTPHREARQSTRTPQKEKSPSVRAGSEEGEIEED